ncbi:MAG: sulfite exporter TauE/SafE family protein [Rhodocyclaceae bacterium]|nr:sulfite exporter TauE/SafE family protein [Rhodocyclaceae bacterium]MBX3667457.1 sulfite exporter TauE/SafE family protein [Rhodocyclaceae bacterium]
MNEWLLIYLALGAFTGFMAGLLGVGGGGILVPLFTMMFAAQGFSETHLLHMALGTAMTTIIFTSVSSFRAHHKHGAVLWPVVKAIAPGIVLGTLAGAQIATRMSTRGLAIFFAVFMGYTATQMLLDIKPKPSRSLPGSGGLFGVGVGIGGISSMVAIGGGGLSVPFMTWCNVKIHNAIGTSSAIGFPIAVSGTIGYMVNGYSAMQEGVLPPGSFGFIYLPALFGTVLTSVIVAPLGVRLAHKLKVGVLKKVFAGMIVVLVARMLYTLFAR